MKLPGKRMRLRLVGAVKKNLYATVILSVYASLVILVIVTAWWPLCFLWIAVFVFTVWKNVRDENKESEARLMAILAGLPSMSDIQTVRGLVWLRTHEKTVHLMIEALDQIEKEEKALTWCRSGYTGSNLMRLEQRQAELTTLRNCLLSAGPHLPVTRSWPR